MTQVVSYSKRDELGNAETHILPLGLQLHLSIIVEDSGELAVAQVTNDPDPNDEDALWADIAFTSNAAAITGPVTGVKLTASANGCAYSIVASQELP